nr:DNA-directed RNA polymerase III subunit RPC7 [Leptinotarsa decemlineata]XP_023020994.1 DNA-directed RNA polymerase III subunit RPC7 [Leptinotarsa decemlineata]
MSGRGRGGRGGRGGVTKTFTKDQLTAMGIASNEALPGPVLEPPPLYPPLKRRPVPLEQSSEMDYLIIVRQNFIDRMQLSGSFLKLPENKNQPERAIDKLVAQLPSAKEKFDWKRFPKELWPKSMAKKSVVSGKPVKDVNIEQKLAELEKREVKSGAVKIERNDEEDENEEMEADEEEDEEMDDDTDYANNYFDNGESYVDEDDNLDDGATY